MNFAIIGASGNVGRKTIEILEKSKIAIDNLFLVASSKSAGKKIKFKNKEIEIEDLENYNFSRAQITFFAAGSKVAKEWVPKAAKETIVIDNSSYFRMQKDVPLVVPEVNSEALNKHKNIIANPNCSTMQMVLPLKPLHDEYKIKRVIVSTYQAVSGAGKEPMDELFDQSRDYLDGKKISISSKSPVEWIEEESYFFRLSKWEKPLLDYYEANPDFISPESRKNEVISFVKSGLKDLSVSRKSFSWGIPVPNNKNHVIYVWLDALTNYLSALNYPNTNDDLFKKFWPASIHLIGKDILRFHAVYWPAFLLAAKIDLPKRVYGHGWILSGEEKMSKSKGNILDPLEIIKEYGLDPLRYYLIKEVSFGNDGNISQERLEDCINSDLANNYGNLCQRVTAFAIKNCNGKIPLEVKFHDEDLLILNKYKDNLDNIRSQIDNQNINFYIDYIVNSLFEANKYFNDQEPWKKKDDKIRLNTIVYTTLEIVRKISFLLYPIIPESSLKALKIFDIKEKNIKLDSVSNNEYLTKGNNIHKIDILFKKIEKNND